MPQYYALTGAQTRPRYADMIRAEAPIARERYFANRNYALDERALEQSAEQFNKSTELTKSQIEEQRKQAEQTQNLALLGLGIEAAPYILKGASSLYGLAGGGTAAASAAPGVGAGLSSAGGVGAGVASAPAGFGAVEAGTGLSATSGGSAAGAAAGGAGGSAALAAFPLAMIGLEKGVFDTAFGMGGGKSSTMFGLKRSVWDSLSPTEKERVKYLSGYYAPTNSPGDATPTSAPQMKISVEELFPGGVPGYDGKLKAGLQGLKSLSEKGFDRSAYTSRMLEKVRDENY
jgi:hypothetical protein